MLVPLPMVAAIIRSKKLPQRSERPIASVSGTSVHWGAESPNSRSNMAVTERVSVASESILRPTLVRSIPWRFFSMSPWRRSALPERMMW